MQVVNLQRVLLTGAVLVGCLPADSGGGSDPISVGPGDGGGRQADQGPVTDARGERATDMATPADLSADGGPDDGVEPAVDDDQDGFSVADGDCDDTDPAIHPGAFQYCDGVDTDCDPATVGQGVVLMNGVTPFATLGDALAAAEATPAADEVVLCDGTYANPSRGTTEITRPLTLRSENGREVTFLSDPQLDLLAPVVFEGLSIVDVDTPNPVDVALQAREESASVTLRDVSFDTAARGDQRASVVQAILGATLVMEGVTVVNGHVELLSRAEVTIRDSTLDALSTRGADTVVSGSRVTGWVALDDYNAGNVGTVSMTDTVLDGASLTARGGVPVTLTDVVIENNVGDEASALNIFGAAVVTMNGGAIRNNRGTDARAAGGAIRAGSSGGNGGFGALNMTDVSVTDNRSQYRGGALYIGRDGRVDIAGGEWLRNSANDAGGAIYLEDGSLNVVNVDSMAYVYLEFASMAHV